MNDRRKNKRVKLTEAIIKAAPILDAEYKIYDESVPQLYVRVRTNGSKTYYFRWRPKGFNPTSQKIGSVNDISANHARARAKQIQSEVFNNKDRYVIKQKLKNEITLEELINTALKAKKYKASTAKSVKNYMDAWILEKSKKMKPYIKYSIKDKRLSQLTNDDFLNVHECIGEKSETSANNVISYLKAVLSYAVKKKLLKHSPITDVPLFQKKLANKTFSSIQREKLLAAAFRKNETTGHLNFNYYRDNRLCPVTCLVAASALLMGRRYKSEICKLKWEWIDWDNKIIHYPDTKVGQKEYKFSQRMKSLLLAIRDSRNDVIKTKPKKYKSKTLAAKFVASPWRLNDDRREYVFPSPRYGSTGATEHITEVKATWRKLLLMCNINYLPLKQARHTVGTLLYKKTKNLELVRKYLGHTTLKTTMRYLDIGDTDIDQGLELMEENTKDTTNVVQLK